MAKNIVKNTRNKNQNNGFIKGNVINYIKHSAPKDLFFDILIPVILSIFITSFLLFIISTPNIFVKTLGDINSTVITIIAILAGFNSASLAIIASSQKLVNSNNDNTEIDKDIEYEGETRLGKFKNLIFNNPSDKPVDAIVSFFAYAVISQLLVLIISLILQIVISGMLKMTITSSVLTNDIEMIMLVICSSIWFALILHSIFLSIRNIDMIAHFIKFSSK